MARTALAGKVAAEVAALSDLPREALALGWEQKFGCPPPKGCGRQLLELAAAHAIQQRAWGGLNLGGRRVLGITKGNAGENDNSQRRKSPAPRRAIKPGTRLVREWNGKTHHVEVAENGFLWNGERHRSLSVIARAITGAQWSGPRFFGL